MKTEMFKKPSISCRQWALTCAVISALGLATLSAQAETFNDPSVAPLWYSYQANYTATTYPVGNYVNPTVIIHVSCSGFQSGEQRKMLWAIDCSYASKRCISRVVEQHPVCRARRRAPVEPLRAVHMGYEDNMGVFTSDEGILPVRSEVSLERVALDSPRPCLTSITAMVSRPSRPSDWRGKLTQRRMRFVEYMR